MRGYSDLMMKVQPVGIVRITSKKLNTMWPLDAFYSFYISNRYFHFKLGLK